MSSVSAFFLSLLTDVTKNTTLVNFDDHAPTGIRGNPRAPRRRLCVSVHRAYQGHGSGDSAWPAGRLPDCRGPSSRRPGRPCRPPPGGRWPSRAADPAGRRPAAERVGGRLRRERRGERRRGARVVRGALCSPAAAAAA
jgi:hypothetical protein